MSPPTVDDIDPFPLPTTDQLPPPTIDPFPPPIVAHVNPVPPPNGEVVADAEP